MKEEWRAVVGFEGLYEVSNLGCVRSVDRMTMGRWGKTKRSPGRVLKQYVGNVGYLRIDLSKNGQTKHYLVHRLVALTFIPQTNGESVNHKDSNRTNNCTTNLDWCTSKENTAHGVRVGRINFPTYKRVAGSKLCCAKGHPFTKDNTYINSSKYKICRTCRNEWAKAHRAEQRQKLSALREKEDR